MIESEKVQLGQPVRTFRIKRRNGWFFLLVSASTVAAIVWGLVWADAPVCAAVPVVIFAWIAAEFFVKRRTVLRLYENGLEYQRLFRAHSVFWDDIEEFGHILRSDYDEAELKDQSGRSVPKSRSIRRASDQIWLQTVSGEKFYLRPDLEDIKQIIDTVSLKLFGGPFYVDNPDKVQTSRKITRRDIDA